MRHGPLSIESQRVKRLAAVIERDLRAGMAREIRVRATDAEDPGLWRRAVVIAAHRLGLRATTFVTGDALVLLVHRPVSDSEKRMAAEAIADLILHGCPVSR